MVVVVEAAVAVVVVASSSTGTLSTKLHGCVRHHCSNFAKFDSYFLLVFIIFVSAASHSSKPHQV